MPTYNFIHPETKAKISVTGDSPPDEATLDQIFSETAGQSAAPKQSYEDFKKAFIADQATTYYKGKEKVKDVVRSAMPYARPVLETAGGLGGGVVGAGSGFLGGLGLGAVPGAVAGGTLGFGAMAQTSDMLEEWAGGTPNADRLANRSMVDRAIVDPASNLKTGLEAALLGEVAAPVIGGAIRVAKAAPKVVMHPIESATNTWNNLAKKSAAKKIAQASTKDGRVAMNSAKNQKVYDALKAKLGDDYQLTPAQITDDPELLKMQQSLQFSHVPSSGPSSRAMLESQMMGNRDVVGKYLDSNFTGSLDDFLAAVDSEVKGRTANVARTAQGLSTADKEVASSQIRTLEQQKLAELKGEAARLYDQVNLDMPVAPGMTFGQWKEARSSALNDLRAARARAASGDASGIMPAEQRVSELESILKQAGEAQPDAFGAMSNRYIDPAEIAKLRTANNFYRDTYVPTVRQGNTAKNLATDRTGGFRVDDEISAGRYLQTGDKGLASANDFNRTFGGDQNARQSLLDYAKRDLYDHATANGTTPLQLNKVEGWIAERMPAMKKMGMENEFSGVKEALVKQSEVEAFGKVLNTNDPNSMLKGLLAANGDKSIAKTALQLKLMVRGNPAAENGLKKAVADLMMDNTQLVKEIGGNPMVSDAKMKEFWKQYGPAMQQIYSKSELEALNTVRTAFKMENRIGRSITGVDGAQSRTMEQEISQATSRSMPMLSATGRVLRFALDFATRGKGQATKDFMAKAQFDPVFAKELSDLANKTKSMSTQAAREEVNKFMGKAMTFGAAVSSFALRDTQY